MSRPIKAIIYRLQRRYGVPATFITRSEDIDFATGDVDTQKMSFVVKRAILMPIKITRSFESLGIPQRIVSSSSFDPRTRWLIVDVPVTLQHECEIRGYRYKVVEVVFDEASSIYYVKVSGLEALTT